MKLKEYPVAEGNCIAESDENHEASSDVGMNPDMYCMDGSDPSDPAITGISGRFPLGDNMAQFSQRLYQKLPQEQSTRHKREYFELNRFISTLTDLSRFDASFFDVDDQTAELMTPPMRLLLEVACEAIFDAGYTPKELSKGRVSVHTCFCHLNATDAMNNSERASSRSIIENPKSCYANLISEMLGFTGPSAGYDNACSTFLCSLKSACYDLASGNCDASIIAGCHMEMITNLNDLAATHQLISNCGFCRPLDAQANGLNTGECVGAVLLQKACKARRIYAKIVKVQEFCAGANPKGIFAMSTDLVQQMLEETYKNLDVDPTQIEYLEMHAPGTQEGDLAEANAAAEVFCKERKKPLLVGSVKGNVGHCMAMAGFTSLAKALVCMERGIVAPNIGCTTPNPHCKALLDGTIKVVTEPVPLEGDFVGINSFGIGGVSAHIILRRNTLVDNSSSSVSPLRKNAELPRLVLHSSQTRKGITTLFDFLNKSPSADRMIPLLHKTACGFDRHRYRGFALFGRDTCIQEISRRQVCKKRPVWYVFSSMGCQWAGMGLDLFRIKAFADSMKKSADVLKPLGIDLYKLLSASDNVLTKHRCMTPAFVSITSIQIALVDVLKSLNISPDGIVGHSTGEIACSYADGCCSAEETLLLAYWRGKAIESTELVNGMMATIGLSWEEAVRRCPEGIYPVCHNTENLVTVSGPTKQMKVFLQQLKAQRVLSRTVKANGFAFHSPYISAAAPFLQENLQKVLVNPKKISSRWVSSSYPKHEWGKPEAKLADASYFTHNLVSPVFFYEALLEIPKDAIIVEIGPHHIFESFLNTVVRPEVKCLSLMEEETDNVQYLMTTLGKMYNLGLNPRVESLYPPANFPVPRSTPCLSDFVSWDHSRNWFVPYEARSVAAVSISSKMKTSCSFFSDHVVKGQAIVPGAAYLVMVWQVLADSVGKAVSESPVVFHDIKFHRVTPVLEDDYTRFHVNILRSSHEFVITDSDEMVVSGRAYIPSEAICCTTIPEYMNIEESLMLTASDIYTMLRIHGLEHGPEFQCLVQCDVEGSRGLIKYNNWITFLDAMLVFGCMRLQKSSLALPIGIDSLKIDPAKHFSFMQENKELCQKGVPVFKEKFDSVCISPGVEMADVHIIPVPGEQDWSPVVLKEYCFQPYVQEFSPDELENSEVYLQACMREVNVISHLRHNGTSVSERTGEQDDICALIPGDDTRVLLCTLKRASEQLRTYGTIRNPKQLFRNYQKKMQGDVLVRSFLKQATIEKVLELWERSSGEVTTDVVEFSSSCYPLSPLFAETARNSVIAQYNFTVAHRSPIIVPPDLLESSGISIEPVSDISYLANMTKNVLIMSILHGDENQLREMVNAMVSANPDCFFIILYRSRIPEPELVLQDVCGFQQDTQSDCAFEDIIEEENLNVMLKLSDSNGLHLYFIKCYEYASSSTVVKIEDTFDKWVPVLQKAIEDIKDKTNARIWLVVEKDKESGLVGLANVLAREENGESIRWVYIRDEDPAIPPFSPEDPFYAEVVARDMPMNMLKGGQWGYFMYQSLPKDLPKRQCSESCIRMSGTTDMSNLQWFNSQIPYWLDSGSNNQQFEVCQVYYTALNFHDVMIASGRIASEKTSQFDEDNALGCEFSGRDSAGRRVFGIGTLCLATCVYCLKEQLYSVPDAWTLEEASTIAIVYSTCYYALLIRGKLKKGEKILIHSGTGGTGQAAINIALSMGCEIFATVGTEQKKEYLLKKFPSLNPNNIGCSRNTAFKDLVMKATEGKGVDVVLNSLAGDKIEAGLACLAEGGRFLDISKYDAFVNNRTVLNELGRKVSYHAIHMDVLLPDPTARAVLLQIAKHVNSGISEGVVKPLDTTVFDSDKVSDAFMYMASGKHVGKIVIKIRDEESEKVVVPQPVFKEAFINTFFYPRKSYIVVGGLGGIGLLVLHWMMNRGARKFVVISRTGINTGFRRFFIDHCRKSGAEIVVSTLNIAVPQEAEELIKTAISLGPVGGIFNLALIVKDAAFPNQSPETFDEVCAPKAAGTRNLDRLSRQLCSADLDWFVCFSSLNAGMGLHGQSNYAYGNSVMERICENRRKDGLPGLAIQLTAVKDVGYFHRQAADSVKGSGIQPLSVNSLLLALDALMQSESTVPAVYVRSESNLRQDIFNPAEIVAAVQKYTDLKSEEDFDKKLEDVGFDSLMITETQIMLRKKCGIHLSASELKQITMNKLIELVKNNFKMEKSSKSFSRESFLNKEALVKLNSHVGGTPLFIISSQKNAAAVCKLADLLKLPTYALQYTGDAPKTSVEDVAAFYLKVISKVEGSQSVNLVGCSWGSLVAIQMASTLTADDSTSKLNSLFLVDAYKCLQNVRMENRMGNKDASLQLDVEVLESISKYCEHWLGIDANEMKEDLSKIPSAHAKISAAAEMATDLLVDKSITKADVEAIFLREHMWMQLLYRFLPQCKVQHEVFVLEAKDDDDDLQRKKIKEVAEKVCSGDVHTFTLFRSEASLLEEPVSQEVAFTINSILVS